MNITNESQKSQIISALQTLRDSDGWKIIQDYLSDKIKNIENNLYEVNQEHNVIKFTGHDLLRFERSHLVGLTKLAENLLDEISGFVFDSEV